VNSLSCVITLIWCNPHGLARTACLVWSTSNLTQSSRSSVNILILSYHHFLSWDGTMAGLICFLWSGTLSSRPRPSLCLTANCELCSTHFSMFVSRKPARSKTPYHLCMSESFGLRPLPEKLWLALLICHKVVCKDWYSKASCFQHLLFWERYKLHGTSPFKCISFLYVLPVTLNLLSSLCSICALA